MSIIDTHLDLFPEITGATRQGGREAAMLRHDICGALQGIMGGVALVDPARLEPETRSQFERIAAAAATLAELHRIAFDGAEPASPKPAIEVAAFLDQIRRRHAGAAVQRGIAFRVEAEPGAPRVLALDRVALGRIVDNLVGNALKFSDRGTISVVLAGDAEGAVLRVLDEGPGMAPEDLERAFGFGFRRDPARPGEGVGLHVVKSLAARLGATVEIANRSGGGMEALVRLPGEATTAPGPREVEPGETDLAGVHVLLAEDNPTNQMVASQMLRALNATVTLCADGVEALERFDALPVDLVVVDIEMPRLSGLDVIRRIRARGDARAGVPIVALTAYAMREHRERIAEAGANGLISKPITSVTALGRGLAAHLGPRAGRLGTAEARTAGHETVIDQAVFDALSQALGPETMRELLEKVVADLEGARRALAEALEPLDHGAIRSASHILVSVAGALGAVRLQACAQELNALAHSGADRTAEEARRCMEEIGSALDFAASQRARD